jgi:hypothetical protein
LTGGHCRSVPPVCPTSSGQRDRSPRATAASVAAWSRPVQRRQQRTKYRG